MSKPAANEQGVPVRKGLYDYETKGGKLQDTNADGQVSFADTWIGDMLGMDGQGGVQGASMKDSMGGARRRAIEVMQAQGVPMTQANLARASNPPPGQQPAGGGRTDGGGATGDGSPGASVDENGNPIGPVAAASAAGAAAAVAALRLYNGKPIEQDGKGNALVPTGGRGGGMRAIPLAEAAEQGWAVVGLNYPDGGNALPKPNTPAIDAIDGDIIDGTATEVDPNAKRVTASPAVDPATAPISTEDIMDPAGSTGAPAGNEIGTVGGDNTRFVDTGQISHGGAPVYSDNVNGGFVTRMPDGSVVHNATMEGLRAAIRAAIR